MNEQKIKELEKKIADLQKQWPAHSIPPAMMQLLDDLEDELAQAKQAQQQVPLPADETP
jgi:hypothetical protein